MFRVLSCLGGEHDLRLVALAGVVCFLASLVAINLFCHVRATQGRARVKWVGLAGTAIGSCIWATHFIAMLAYEPGVPVAYDIGLTALSLVAAIAVTSVGLAIAANSPGRWSAPTGGGIVGVGVACMHYTGMAAIQLPGHVTWFPNLVLASVAIGVVFGAAALTVTARRDDTRGMVAAALLLTLGIVSHHFTAMGALDIVPDPTRVIAGFSFSPTALALAVAAVPVAVVGMSLIGAAADSRLAAKTRQLIEDSEEKLREQHLRLDTALNTMTQGLNMFDARGRLVVCNERYIQMYRLPPDIIKPGCTVRDLVEYRIAAGTFFSTEPEEYIAGLQDAMNKRCPTNATLELTDGRVVTVISQPTSSGSGWVVTHEDVTERHRLLRAQKATEEQVRNQHIQLDAALNSMRQGLLMFDPDTRLILCNDRYLQMYGLSRDAANPGCTLRDLLVQRKATGTFRGDLDQYIANLVHYGKAETKVVDLPDGRTISVANAPVEGGGWVSTHDDITARRQSEKELDRTRTFLNTIIENVPATIVVKDARDHRYVLINRYGEEFFGMSRDEMIGKNAYDFFSKDEADVMTARDNEVLHTRQQLFIENNPVHTPRKGVRLVTNKRLAIVGDDGEPQYLLAVIEDVTERRRAEERIAHLAHHDALTDLPNRVAFTEYLSSMLDRAAKSKEGFAVLCIDVDRFKEVNDVFGHSVGDGLLRDVARRLQEALEGAFLARLGGDEFTIIVDGPQPSTAEALGDRLLATVAGELDIEGQQLRIGLSIGVAIYPNDGVDATTLLSNADAALYRSKAEGRGTIRFFAADMDQRLRERRAMQHDLRSAIERSELVLHYQPQALIDGKIIGFEALVRWHHPNQGLIPPGAFIPLAEESGLIIPIGEWILREACREAASWPRPLQVAINLSPIQFRHGDLPELVHSVLLETGLAPGRLELEITEGVLIGDFSRATSILRRLKTLGLRIAMDDFGTGYSSLSYLQSFPFDKIKIDRAFISNVDRNVQSAAIIRAVIGLGRGLDLPVVAEGVETKDQLAFLSREACDEVQGYLVGRPAPIEEYAEMVGQSSPSKPMIRFRG
jgi:diguanylate cyclase (GGDEF)-like protein/PAS domain S-box-containing protein